MRGKRRARKLGTAVAAAAIAPLAAEAATITVNSAADDTTANGQCTLREAILNANNDAATSPDCAAGTGDDVIDFNFGAATVITLTADLPTITEAVTIDGPGPALLGIDAVDAFRPFTIDDGAATAFNATIRDMSIVRAADGAIVSAENLTLVSMSFDSNETPGNGGAVAVSGYLGGTDLTLTVQDSTFTDNDADYAGGAIAADRATVSITNSTFSNNDADGGGGAIALYLINDTTITNTTIMGNVADGSGGGLYFYAPQGDILITGSTITGNISEEGSGGGIAILDAYAGSVEIRNTSISSNVGFYTGGIAIDGGVESVTFDTVRVVGNSGSLDGGGIRRMGGPLDVIDSEITNNRSAAFGGVYLYDGNATFTNSTIAFNQAQAGVGGGIGAVDSDLSLVLSTLSNNTATANGGNVYLVGSYLTVENSIIANGTALAGQDIHLEGPDNNVVSDYSLIETPPAGLPAGTNIFNTDPLLGPLQNNGGPTATMKPANNSPAVNAGDPAFTPPPATDQRKFPRPVGRVDMGAVEINAGVLAFSPAVYNTTETGVTVTITVTRTGGADGAVSVDFATSNGSAVAPSDYANTTGTLNWADNDAAPKTFTVAIVNDGVFEGPESFNLTLSNPTNGATLGVATATVNITDAQAAPVINVNDASTTEGDSGTKNLQFTVTLSGPAEDPVAVGFTTAGGTATPGTDFAAQSGTITFAPGDVSEPVNIVINGDTTVEPDETFTLDLTPPAGFNDDDAVGTILNDDAATIAITSVSDTEGNGGTRNFVFTVSLVNPSASTVIVPYTTADGTATAGTDYTATSGTVTFVPGDQSETVTVPVTGDTTVEPDETFTIDLTPPAPYNDPTGTGTIVNDDGSVISITNVTDTEGNAGTKNFVFTVSLANPSATPVVVGYSTVDGTATAGSDYVATSGTVTFAAGDQSETITVVVNGDTSFEADETFTVDLTPPAPFNDAAGTGTILNDDLAVADLRVTKVATTPQPYAAGQNVTFQITVTNNGPQGATNVVLTDTLPAGMTFVSASASCSGTATVTCNLGSLANGGSTAVTLTVQVNQPGTFTNTATADSPELDPDGASGSATITAGAVANPIPTASEWMLIALASALAAAAALKLRS